jgi:hypothetical protein
MIENKKEGHEVMQAAFSMLLHAAHPRKRRKKIERVT